MDKNNVNKNNNTPQLNPASGGVSDLPPLPKLEVAEDNTFSPPPAPPIVEGKSKSKTGLPVPPLPNEPAISGGSDQRLEETPVKGDSADGVPPNIDGTTSNGDVKPKKKLNKKAIVGGVIALLLLVGVPLVALNMDKFRGDIRQRASYDCKEDCLASGGYPPSCNMMPACSSSSSSSSSGGPTCREECIAAGGPPSGCNQLPLCGSSSSSSSGSSGSSGSSSSSSSSSSSGGGGSCVGELNVYLSLISGGSFKAGIKVTTSDGKNKKIVAQGTDKKKLSTGIILDGSQTVTVNGWDNDDTTTPWAGYIPLASNKCGKAPFTLVDMTDKINWATGDAKSIFEHQCWGDFGEELDYNDWFVSLGCEKDVTSACAAIKIYTLQNASWVATNPAQISQHANSGDKIRFAVRGNSSQFSKGRFKINDAATWITTSTKNAAGEFYIEYTLPATKQYSIEAQVQ